MGDYTIYPLNLGTITRETSIMAYGVRPGIKVDLPVFAWYLTDGKEKILVDTGGVAPDGVRFMPYVQSREQQLDQALLAVGVRCEEITTVILTHAHWDHCGQNHLFSNAAFYVQKKELQFAAAPIPQYKKSYLLPLIFQTEYEILDGDVQFRDGILLALTPGHSPGSQSVIVDTADGKYALVGDLVNFRECWLANPKIPNGHHTDLETCYQSFEKVERLIDRRAERVLMAHEPLLLGHGKFPH